jgi:putative hydrolase of the HAD superfamily
VIVAVLFDLYDTLAGLPQQSYVRSKSALARLAGVSEAEFARVWAESRQLSSVGTIRTMSDRMQWCLRSLGVAANAETTSEMIEVENNLQLRETRLLPGAKETLAALRAAGYKTGLVSNGPTSIGDVPRVLSIEPLLDAIVFSFAVGWAKPDRRIYLEACDCLGVAAGDCVYVGDGNDQELDGAAALGMATVLIRHDRNEAALSADSSHWDHEICSLMEVLPLVERLRTARR